ncbi:uncharacterized protein LOC129617418 [Condylostylus longicornis]|uniref:uncharacterized protein LOC129617418 n=1 Tax=Condylostylus longicornis TaxID=2530218 RepID=UPI00244E48A6|nr:uncharacterized protein LOC129617418 [Condylostylus longicornis]
MAQQEEEKAVIISVPSKEPTKHKKKNDKKKKEEEELSEETQKIKDEIELLAERVRDSDDGVAQLALQTLSLQLRGATTTMTSVPLPLKFLRPYFGDIELHYESLPDDNSNKTAIADVLSILATVVPNDTRKALHYRLRGSKDGLTSWGQEYLRNISGELSAEYDDRQNKLLDKLMSSEELKPELEVSVSVFLKRELYGTNSSVQDLLNLVFQIVPFYMKHHNEIDAIDLLSEVEQIEAIARFVDEKNYSRVTHYLLALSNYAASDEEWTSVLHVTYNIFIAMVRNFQLLFFSEDVFQEEYCQAVRVGLKLRDTERVRKAISSCSSSVVKKQIGYLLAAYQINLQELNISLEEEPDLLTATNDWLSEMYKLLGKELDVLEPKTPEDVYKAHLEDRRGATGFFLDSAKMNLASTYVNAFVNAGFGTDKLMTVDDSSWIYKNREHGMLAAAASVGSVMLWNVEDGIQSIDKFRWASDPMVKAGALLAFGLVCSSTNVPGDYAFGLLSDQVEAGTGAERDATILGLGISHAGWHREELLSLSVPLIIDTSIPNETSAFAALGLSLTFVGSANENAAEAILQTLMERQAMPGNLDEPVSYLFGLSLGLLFLGRKDSCEATLEALETISEHPTGKYASSTVMGFAFAGSGDVAKVQQFLKACIEQDDDKDSKEEAEEEGTATGSDAKPAADSEAKVCPMRGMHQASAVLSMVLVALGEPYGTDMQLRMLDHLLQYGNTYIRRAVPLGLALLSTSNPKPSVVESLSKLTHDTDSDVGLNAVLALGFVGAGTNNAKIADLLRQLASSYYSRSLNGLFCVRLSQGLLYMGKGLMTISPILSDGFLISPVSLASLLVTLHSCLFLKQTFLGRFHYLLFALLPAMRPRMLLTLDEELHPLPVTVRVGQAVDTAGQAGNPRSVTGFQTHTTPVLLGAGERAELATSDYVPVTSGPLEGVVILKKGKDTQR